MNTKKNNTKKSDFAKSVVFELKDAIDLIEDNNHFSSDELGTAHTLLKEIIASKGKEQEHQNLLNGIAKQIYIHLQWFIHTQKESGNILIPEKSPFNIGIVGNFSGLECSFRDTFFDKKFSIEGWDTLSFDDKNWIINHLNEKWNRKNPE